MTFEELEVLIKDNFETFMADGFDINSDKSLNDLFFVLFKQGWLNCLDAAEGEE